MVVGFVGVLVVAPVIAQQPEIFVQLGHVGSVRAVAWSPDGRTVASGGADGAVKFWDARRGHLLRSVIASQEIESVDWNPAGGTLATAGADGVVRLWNADSGQSVATLPWRGKAQMPRSSSAAWSPDGRTLAVGSGDGAIRLWKPGLSQQQVVVEAHSGAVFALAWHPDGNLLASSGAEGSLSLWDTLEANRTRRVETLTLPDPVHSLAWNPGGTVLVGAGGGVVRFWDRRGLPMRSLAAVGVRQVAWNPDGGTLAVAQAGKVDLWSPLGAPLREMPVDPSAVAWNASGSLLAIATGGAVEIWESEGVRARVLEGPAERLASVEWSSDGRSLLTATLGSGLLRWDAASGKPVKWYGAQVAVSAAAWSRDGGLIAAASGNTVEILLEQSGPLEQSGKILWALVGHAAPVTAVAFSADGTQLASASRDSTVRVWNIAAGDLARTLRGHEGPVHSVAFGQNGLLASGGADGVVRVWGNQRSRELRGHTGPVHAIGWSHDGKRLASVGTDNTLMLWDPVAGRAERMIGGHRAAVVAMGWSVDGQSIMTGGADGALKIWNAWTGDLLRGMPGHDGPVEGVAWSPDSRVVATVGRDSSLRRWEAASGREIASSTLLPNREWMVWRRGALPFAASPGGAKFAAIRFGALRPVYPLTHYEGELKRSDLALAWSQATPIVQPKWVRAMWENAPYKRALFGVLGAIAVGAALARLGRSVLREGFKKRLARTLALPPPAEVPLEPLVGRDDLVRELAGLLSAHGVQVGVCGLPMSGKTQLVGHLRAVLGGASAAVLDCRGLAALAEAVHRDGMRRLRGRRPRVLIIENADLINVASLSGMFRGVSVLYTATRPIPGVANHILSALDDVAIAELLRDATPEPWERAVFDAAAAFCGGDAYVARLFTSELRARPVGRQVDVEDVFAAARVIRDNFSGHPIGTYFREHLWPSLTDEERAALEVAARGPAQAPRGLLVEFGLVSLTRDGLAIRSQLLRSWVLTKPASVAVRVATSGS